MTFLPAINLIAAVANCVAAGLAHSHGWTGIMALDLILAFANLLCLMHFLLSARR